MQFFNKEAGLTNSVGMVRDNVVLHNPALCPAFRVRRGRRSTCVAMTRYVGSRASGYPPDLVSFRRSRWGFAPTAAASRAHVGIARVAVLPFGSLGLASGKPRSRAGVPKAKQQ